MLITTLNRSLYLKISNMDGWKSILSKCKKSNFYGYESNFIVF